MEQISRSPPIDIPRHDAAEANAHFNQATTEALARLNTMPTPRTPHRSLSQTERVATLDGVSEPVNQPALPASLSFQALAQLNGTPSSARLAASHLHTSDERFSFTEYRDRDEDSDSSEALGPNDEEDSVSYDYLYSDYESEYEDSSLESESSEAVAAVAEAEVMDCCICFEETSANDIATIDGCVHKFCMNCVTQWSESSNQCPLCRTRFTSIQSAEGGVLHQVPDSDDIVDFARDIVMARRDLTDSFDREQGEEDNSDPFTAMLRQMLEQQNIRYAAPQARMDNARVERLETGLERHAQQVRERVVIRLEMNQERVARQQRALDRVHLSMVATAERLNALIEQMDSNHALLEQMNSNF